MENTSSSLLGVWSERVAKECITRKSVEQVTSVDEGALQKDSAATYTAWRYARGTHSTSDVNQGLRSTDWGKTTGESWSRGWGNTPLEEKPWVVSGSYTTCRYSRYTHAGTWHFRNLCKKTGRQLRRVKRIPQLLEGIWHYLLKDSISVLSKPVTVVTYAHGM